MHGERRARREDEQDRARDVRPSGAFAEYHGVTYPTTSPHTPGLRLWLPDGVAPRPEFEADSRGRWSAYVPREDVDRIYQVTTRARWGEHEVEVVERRGGRLRVEAWTYPPPPGTRMPENTYWDVLVDPQDLTDVVETVREVAP